MSVLHTRFTSAIHPFILVCLFLASVLAPAPVLADVVDFQASKDNTLFEEDDSKSNGSGDYTFAGNNDAAETRRALIGFDLSSIPPGSTINAVTLTVVMSRTKARNVSVSLHRLLADWGEGASNADAQEGAGISAELNDATWRYRFYDPNDVPGSPQWSTLGGDFVAGPSATVDMDRTGTYSWSNGPMISDVQGWVDSPATNFGWIIIGGESGQKLAKRFNSRQNGDVTTRPVLTVDFTLPAGACCIPAQSCQVLIVDDCTAQGGTFQGPGTSCIPDPCVDPTGGCCFGDGSCTELSAASCSGSGGAYQGDGTGCTPNVCPQPIGACCSDTSPWDCTEITQGECTAQGGTYQGDDQLCSVLECPVLLQPFLDPLPLPGAAQPVAGASGDAATYHIVMQELQQQLHSELPPTTVWGYGARPESFDPAAIYASYPGPTVEAFTGRPVTIRYFNDLRDTALGGSPPPLRTTHYLNVDTCPHGADDQTPRTVVHLHGGHVEAESDGYPEHTFLPGQEAAICVTDPAVVCIDDLDCPAPGECDGDGASCNNDGECVGHGGAENCLLCEPGYHYPNQQQASMIWFHDHALGITRLNVYMGMAALYVLRDAFEESLALPSGEFEAPLVIQDRSFHPDGTWKYPEDWVENFFGDKALVNGKVWPVYNVKQGKYRLRLLNGSNSRRYSLSLDRTDVPGTQDLVFNQIGTDGGLLTQPVTIDQITLGPAERADTIVDFEGLAPGTEILLANSVMIPTAPDLPFVMKFVVQAEAGDTRPLPSSLRPVEQIDPASAVRTRQFLLRKGSEPCTGQAWFIKSRNEDGVDVGQLWDDITEFPQLGTTEIWEFANPTVVPHPMHMHLVFFQILSRQDFELVDDQIVPIGTPVPPPPNEAGWKDTARAEPDQILRVIARFEDYEGEYAYHCHILEHEDHEMMRQFRTVGPVMVTVDKPQISWGAVPGATGYDLVRGDLGTLRANAGDFGLATGTCLVQGLLVFSYNDTDVPLPGDGFWYLNRFRDAVGDGTYDSGSAFQVGHRDDGIASSGNDCP